MPIQTAPSTMTVATATGNTVFTLVDLADNELRYRAASVGGQSIIDERLKPELTITRRPATKANPNVKYDFVLETSSFDPLGTVAGKNSYRFSATKSARYDAGAVADLTFDEMAKALGLILGVTEIQNAIMDGSFFR